MSFFALFVLKYRSLAPDYQSVMPASRSFLDIVSFFTLPIYVDDFPDKQNFLLLIYNNL